MLVVYTASLGYRGRRPVLNITRQLAHQQQKAKQPAPGAPFAPSWAILKPAKTLLKQAAQLREQGKAEPAAQIEQETWGKYRRAYLAEMLVSADRPIPPGWEEPVARARKHGVVPVPEAWTNLLAEPERVLLCYCRDPAMCHRTLLASVLGRLGAEVRGEVVPYGVLACGSRRWLDGAAIERQLRLCHPDTFVVHGDATGADTLIDRIAKAIGYRTHARPADWSLYRSTNGAQGRGAGHARNADMLAEFLAQLREGIAFGPLTKPDGDRTGTGGMVARLREAGLPVLSLLEPNGEPRWIDDVLPARLLQSEGP